MHPKEGLVTVYLGESGGTSEDMGDLEGWGLVVLTDDGLCSSPWDQGISSPCCLPFWGTSGC